MGRKMGVLSIVFCFVILALSAYLIHNNPVTGDGELPDETAAKAEETSIIPTSPVQPTISFQPEPDTPLPESTPQEPKYVPLTSIPVGMTIPALDVDTEIQPTGRDGNTMAIIPSPTIISWYELSAIPGNEGNCLLAGHRAWNGQKGRLASLDTLSIGDEMTIQYEDGSSNKFLLESVFVYALATAPADKIMDVNGEARVTVITCKEPFNPATGTSDFRIVATFKEESVFVIPDPPIEPLPPRAD